MQNFFPSHVCEGSKTQDGDLGKFGCDNLELRSFCLKHSKVQDVSSTQQLGVFFAAVGSNISCHPPMTSINKPHKLKIALRNGDKIVGHVETPDNNSNRVMVNFKEQDCQIPNQMLSLYQVVLMHRNSLVCVC